MKCLTIIAENVNFRHSNKQSWNIMATWTLEIEELCSLSLVSYTVYSIRHRISQGIEQIRANVFYSTL